MRQEHGYHRLLIAYDVPFVQTTVTEETYDDSGVLVRTAATVWEFNATGNPEKVTDALGHQRVNVYDPQMNVTREELWENVGTPQNPERVLHSATGRTYTAQGRLETLTKAAGFPEQRTTRYTYYPNGLLHEVVRPSVALPGKDHTTTYVYEPAGTLQYATLRAREEGYLGDQSPFTYETVTTFDAQGRPTSIDGPRPGTIDVTTHTYSIALEDLRRCCKFLREGRRAGRQAGSAVGNGGAHEVAASHRGAVASAGWELGDEPVVPKASDGA